MGDDVTVPVPVIGLWPSHVQDPMGTVRWGDDVGVTWANAPLDVKERFALVRLYWFHRMIACGGPDGSDLDDLVAAEATEAAEWFGPILDRRATEAGC